MRQASKQTDEFFMSRALELAARGAGFVSPNPQVGCVIVKNGRVIGEGYHRKFGGPHAEIEAMKKCKITNTTVYVNLEPCCHFGKTPPCVDALIAAGVKRVVVGMPDPNPLVQGRGIKKLRAAGIDMTVGVLKEACAEANEIFIKWITTGKPYVLLKCALTLDGALTFVKGTRSDFSSPESYSYVHELRQTYDAIGLGSESVLIDDPLLTTRRPGRRRNPVRVIFDTHLRFPEKARLLREAGMTLIFTGGTVDESKRKKLIVEHKEVEVVSVSFAPDGHLSLSVVMAELGKRQVTSIMVEGGAIVARSLLREGLVDKIALTFTPHLATDKLAPRLFTAPLRGLTFRKTRWQIMGRDAWFLGWIH